MGFGISLSATSRSHIVGETPTEAAASIARARAVTTYPTGRYLITITAAQRAEVTRTTSLDDVACSLSRSGNVWDNAVMESFFSSLKVERVARKIYRTRDEARADVFDYIERFYNPRRRHSTIPLRVSQWRSNCRVFSRHLGPGPRM